MVTGEARVPDLIYCVHKLRYAYESSKKTYYLERDDFHVCNS